MKLLHFTPGGEYLLHVQRDCVAVRDVPAGKVLHRCPGAFIGISRNGQAFLTHLADGSCALWETTTGISLPLNLALPGAFELHQRVTYIPGIRELTVQVVDVFQVRQYPQIQIPYTRGEATLENWAVAPDNQTAAAVIGGSEGGFDWSEGYCFALKTGALLYRFQASADLLPAPLFFSAEHILLLSGHTGGFWVYDLSSGNLLREVRLSSGSPYIGAAGGAIIDAHPRDRWRVAINASIPEQYPKKGVRILNIKEKDTVAVEHTLVESERISDVRFHPDGNSLAILLSSGVITLWKP